MTECETIVDYVIHMNGIPVCSEYILTMYVPQSEVNIDCPSNSSSEPLNPHLKFKDARCLVVQHIS